MEEPNATNNPSGDPVDTGQSLETGTGSEVVDAAPDTSSSEAPATDASQESTSESTVDDPRFKEDPGKLYDSYKELESKYGETSQKAKLVDKLAEVSGMSVDQIEDYIARQTGTGALRPTPEASDSQAYPANNNVVNDETLQKINSLEQRVALQEEEKEIARLTAEVPEAVKFTDRIRKIGRYETNKTHKQIYDEYFKPALKQGKDAAYQKLNQKEQSQVESNKASTSQPMSSEKITPDMIRGASKDPQRMAQIREAMKKQGLL